VRAHVRDHGIDWTDWEDEAEEARPEEHEEAPH
jgi:hypothetical protein